MIMTRALCPYCGKVVMESDRLRGWSEVRRYLAQHLARWCVVYRKRREVTR